MLLLYVALWTTVVLSTRTLLCYYHNHNMFPSQCHYGTYLSMYALYCLCTRYTVMTWLIIVFKLLPCYIDNTATTTTCAVTCSATALLTVALPLKTTAASSTCLHSTDMHAHTFFSTAFGCDTQTQILRKHRHKLKAGGCVHSFDGTLSEAQALIAEGLHIGMHALYCTDHTVHCCTLQSVLIFLTLLAVQCIIRCNSYSAYILYVLHICMY
jgi:hypothetical protein